MNIGIVGAGQVGGTLGRRFAEQGHQIVYGSRDLSSTKLSGQLAHHPGTTRVAALPALAAETELLLLSVPFAATRDALSQLGALTGKTLIDATNPLLPNLAGLAVGRDDSQGEQVARLAPGAKVVKAFNTIRFKVMADPLIGGRRAFLPVASDHQEAKRSVIELARSIGFDALDFGPLANARYTEPLAMVWIYLAHVQGLGVDMALTLSRRSP